MLPKDPWLHEGSKAVIFHCQFRFYIQTGDEEIIEYLIFMVQTDRSIDRKEEELMDRQIEGLIQIDGRKKDKIDRKVAR